MGGSNSKSPPPTCWDPNGKIECNMNTIIWGGGANGNSTSGENAKVCNGKKGLCRSIQYIIEHLIKENYAEFNFNDGENMINSPGDDQDDQDDQDAGFSKLNLKIGSLDTSNYKSNLSVFNVYRTQLKTRFKDIIDKPEDEHSSSEESSFVIELNKFIALNDGLEDGKIYRPQLLIDTFIIWKIKALIISIIVYYVDNLFDKSKFFQKKKGWSKTKTTKEPETCYNVSFRGGNSDKGLKETMCHTDPAEGGDNTVQPTELTEEEKKAKLPHDHPLCIHIVDGLSEGFDLTYNDDTSEIIKFTIQEENSKGIAVKPENGSDNGWNLISQKNHWTKKPCDNLLKIFATKLYNNRITSQFSNNELTEIKSRSDVSVLPNIELTKRNITTIEPDNVNEFYFIKNTLFEWIKSQKYMKRLYELREWVKVISSGACDNCPVINCNEDIDNKCKEHLFDDMSFNSESTNNGGKWDKTWDNYAKKKLELRMDGEINATDSWWIGDNSKWSKKCKDKVVFDKSWIDAIPDKIETAYVKNHDTAENSDDQFLESWWGTPIKNTATGKDVWESSIIMKECKKEVQKKGNGSAWNANSETEWSKIAKDKLEEDGTLDDTDAWWGKTSDNTENPWIKKCRENVDGQKDLNDEWIDIAGKILNENIDPNKDYKFWKSEDGETNLQKNCRENIEWNTQWSDKAHTALRDEEGKETFTWTPTQWSTIIPKANLGALMDITEVKDEIKEAIEGNNKDGKKKSMEIIDEWWENRSDNGREGEGWDQNPWQAKCRERLKNDGGNGKSTWTTEEIAEIFGKTFHSGADVSKVQNQIKTSVDLNKLYSNYDIKNKTILNDIEKKKKNQFESIKSEQQNKDKMLHFIHSTKNKINNNTNLKNTMIGLLVIVFLVIIIFVVLLLKKYKLFI